jgi:hypothetical protein
MPRLGQKQSGRQRLGWLTGELIVVFAGVSGAFVVKNYRHKQYGTGLHVRLDAFQSSK